MLGGCSQQDMEASRRDCSGSEDGSHISQCSCSSKSDLSQWKLQLLIIATVTSMVVTETALVSQDGLLLEPTRIVA